MLKDFLNDYLTEDEAWRILNLYLPDDAFQDRRAQAICHSTTPYKLQKLASVHPALLIVYLSGKHERERWATEVWGDEGKGGEQRYKKNYLPGG